MLARSIGYLDRIKNAAGTAVFPDEIDLTRRQSRVHHHRPGIDLRGGEDQRDEREAVLADDHDPVAGTNIVELEDKRRVRDDRRQLGVGPGDIALHQGWTVWAVVRNGLILITSLIRSGSSARIFSASCRAVVASMPASVPWSLV